MKIEHSMTMVSAMALAATLAACNRETPQAQMQTVPLPVPAPEPAADLVSELARNPARLEEVRRLCREDRTQVDEELCIASAQAVRQRFMGDGETKYTPESVRLPDTELPDVPTAGTQDE